MHVYDVMFVIYVTARCEDDRYEFEICMEVNLSAMRVSEALDSADGNSGSSGSIPMCSQQ